MINHNPAATLGPKTPRNSLTHRSPTVALCPDRPPIPRRRLPALAILTLCALLCPPGTSGSALEFPGTPGQWARYGRWGSGGRLSFSLKTNVSRALLLYMDDGGNCDFLELLVAEGRLRLRFAIACAEPAVVASASAVNDGRWHSVMLSRRGREAALAVDGETLAGVVRSKRAEMAVGSDLFVGGIPPDVRLSALTLSTVKYEAPFRGWVAELRVGEEPAVLLGRRRCAQHPPCAHGGRCALRRGEPQCDCAGTGHSGPFCGEGEGAGGVLWGAGLWGGGCGSDCCGVRGCGSDCCGVVVVGCRVVGWWLWV
uniref:Neurexin 2 n=1 Tax=Meleagris gallopavo TaxID=9103 RepID=A0A803YN76_MELGA